MQKQLAIFYPAVISIELINTNDVCSVISKQPNNYQLLIN